MFEIATDEVLWYVDYALGEMTRIVSELGDALVNEKPALPGANSPFAIVTHCLGVMEFWGGEKVAGREVQRDRAAEFAASGGVSELVARIRRQSTRFADDLRAMEATARPHTPYRDESLDHPFVRSQAGVVLHVLEELFQHLGHLELTRDLLVAIAGQQAD